MSIDNQIEIALNVYAKESFYDFPSLYNDHIGEYMIEHRDADVVEDILLTEGLIITTGKKHANKITGKGFRVAEAGGYKKYKAKEEQKEKIAAEKDYYQAKMSKFQARMFWPAFGFTVVGSGIAIYNFIKDFL